MGDYSVLKTGFLNFAAHRKTKSDRRLFKLGNQDRAPLSLWVRHEKKQRAGSSSRCCDYGQKEVLLGKKKCPWSLQWEGAGVGESYKHPARLESQLPLNSITINNSSVNGVY